MGLSKRGEVHGIQVGEAGLRNYGRLGVDKIRDCTWGTVAGAVEVGRVSYRRRTGGCFGVKGHLAPTAQGRVGTSVLRHSGS